MGIIHDKCAAFEAVIVSQSNEITELKEKIKELEMKLGQVSSITPSPTTKECETVDLEQPQLNNLSKDKGESNYYRIRPDSH